jgi:hypothetical protein
MGSGAKGIGFFCPANRVESIGKAQMNRSAENTPPHRASRIKNNKQKGHSVAYQDWDEK